MKQTGKRTVKRSAKRPAKQTARKAQSAPSNGRVERSKEAVLTATLQLMFEAGLSGVSVDTVSQRSGVAKTTIYRHWPSRSALLMDACARMGTTASAWRAERLPDTGSLEGDVLELATGLAHRLHSAKWASILPSVIDAAERDPDIAKLHSRMHAGFMAGFRAVIERAESRSGLPPGRSAAELVAAVVGPLFYRRWFSREPLDDGFVKGVVANAVRASR